MGIRRFNRLVGSHGSILNVRVVVRHFGRPVLRNARFFAGLIFSVTLFDVIFAVARVISDHFRFLGVNLYLDGVYLAVTGQVAVLHHYRRRASSLEVGLFRRVVGHSRVSRQLTRFFIFFTGHRRSIIRPVISRLLPHLYFTLNGLIFIIQGFRVLTTNVGVCHFTRVLHYRSQTFSIPAKPSIPGEHFPVSFA